MSCVAASIFFQPYPKPAIHISLSRSLRSTPWITSFSVAIHCSVCLGILSSLLRWSRMGSTWVFLCGSLLATHILERVLTDKNISCKITSRATAGRLEVRNRFCAVLKSPRYIETYPASKLRSSTDCHTIHNEQLQTSYKEQVQKLSGTDSSTCFFLSTFWALKNRKTTQTFNAL